VFLLVDVPVNIVTFEALDRAGAVQVEVFAVLLKEGLLVADGARMVLGEVVGTYLELVLSGFPLELVEEDKVEVRIQPLAADQVGVSSCLDIAHHLVLLQQQ
jgi:hypothetical protein